MLFPDAVARFFTDVSYNGLTGLMAGAAAVCMKILVELLDASSNGGDNAVGTPRLWICGLLVAVLNVVDLHTYTLAVKRADIVVVYPIYNAYAITFTMLSGIFVLGEGDDMQTWGKLLVVAAVVCFACGTPLLCRSSVRRSAV